MTGAGFLDLAEEGFFHLHADGSLLPRNAAMSAWLSEIESVQGRKVRGLLDLPFADEDVQGLRRFLESGESRYRSTVDIRLGRETRVVQLALRSDERGSGYLGASRDQTALRRAKADLMRVERLRTMGALGSGLIHDLNNLVGTVLGLAEHMLESDADRNDRSLLQSCRESMQTGTVMLSRLERMLTQAPIARATHDLGDLVEESLSLFTKTAILSGSEVAASYVEHPPRVRVVAEESMHAMLEMMLFVRDTSDPGATIRIEVDRVRRAAAGDGMPQRSFGQVRVASRGDEGAARALGDLLAHPERGLVDAIGGLPGDRTVLSSLAAAVQAWGGLLEYQGVLDGGRTLALLLPAAGER